MRPTVRDAATFNAEEDAKALHKAFKGLGTDGATVIKVLANRSNKQRCEIARSFKNQYGKELKEALKSELSGKFETICLALVTPYYDFLASELHAAMAGLGTNEGAIADILGPSSNNTVKHVSESYKRLYDTSLEKDIKKDTSGALEQLLVLLCQANRDESTDVDAAAVTKDVVALYNAGEARMGTDETTFVSIIALRSFPHLRAVFSEYKRASGHSFESAVLREFQGGTEEALVNIVRAIKSPHRYYAARLQQVMKGIGTNESLLIRVVVARAELDLGDIADTFARKNEKSLSDAVKNETSGDFRKMLLALLD